MCLGKNWLEVLRPGKGGEGVGGRKVKVVERWWIEAEKGILDDQTLNLVFILGGSDNHLIMTKCRGRGQGWDGSEGRRGEGGVGVGRGGGWLCVGMEVRKGK